MSSGYSSLEEDSEEYFFTARTSLPKKSLLKPPNIKVNCYLFILFIMFFFVYCYNSIAQPRVI